MQLKRIGFANRCYVIETWTEETFFSGKKEHSHKIYKDRSIDEIMEEINAFIDKIGKENVVNISEYRSCKERIGDDQILNIVLYYWDSNA